VLLEGLQRCFHLFISHKHHLLIYRAGDEDRTRDVQGRKSLSVTTKHPLGMRWFQLGSPDDAILGSF
jgi:hypothetical protein